MLCVHLYVPPIRAGIPDASMNIDVENNDIYEILIMHGIKLITKTDFLQGSDTNLELNA